MNQVNIGTLKDIDCFNSNREILEGHHLNGIIIAWQTGLGN